MRSFCTMICVLLFSIPCYATDYYVDRTGGSNTDTGTSIGQAWQTIDKVNSEMGRFIAGDRILFKRGETWAPGSNTDGLRITCEGASGNHITFGAYGTGPKPVITFSGHTGDGRYSGADEVCIFLMPECGYITIENFKLVGAANNMAVEFTGVGSPTGPVYIQSCDISGDGYASEALVANNFPSDSMVTHCTFDATNSYSKAIEVKRGAGVVIADNEIIGFGTGGGIRFSNHANYGIIERNKISHPLNELGYAFAICYRSADNGGIIRNNFIDLRGSTLGPKLLRGITGWLGTNGRKVYNNTIVGEGYGSAFRIEDRQWVVKNNLIINMHTVFNISDNGGAVAERNAYYNCNTYVDNDNIFNDLGENINTDPEIGNLQLTAIRDAIPKKGSPLINKGASDDNDIPSVDFLKNERDTPDIGAFEYIYGPGTPKNLRIVDTLLN